MLFHDIVKRWGAAEAKLLSPLVNAILNATLELQRNNMDKFFNDREAIVRSVRKLLKNLAVGSQLTINIEREKFAEYFVTAATTSMSEDTPTEISSEESPLT